MPPNDSLPAKLVRLPIYIPFLLLSILATMPIYASVTCGSWVEAALRHLGVEVSDTLIAISGVCLYTVGGLILPVVIGGVLFQMWGAVLAPILIWGGIAILGRW